MPKVQKELLDTLVLVSLEVEKWVLSRGLFALLELAIVKDNYISYKCKDCVQI